MSKKVYELASLLGLTNNQMLEVLWANEIDVKYYTDVVSEELEEKIKKYALPKFNGSSHKNNSSLKYIHIIGLFNKKDYKICFETDINLFIAENGFGNTTILNIIVAVLKGDKKKLKVLPFEKIIIGTKNKDIEISKEELNDNKMNRRELRFILRAMKDILPNSIQDRFYKEVLYGDELDIKKLELLLKQLDKLEIGGNVQESLNEVLWILEKNNSRIDISLEKKLEEIRSLVEEEILYFPTYRRIEEGLDNFENLGMGQTTRFKNSAINFGMRDVESVINELTTKLKEEAIENYSIMNAAIIDDLLTDELMTNNQRGMTIDSEVIKIIIGRIGAHRIKYLEQLIDFVQYQSDVANKTFLEYYLGKLVDIYEHQKPIDDKIKKYRDVCNRYLVNKEIIYDEVKTEVSIQDKDNGKKINFEDLSSGEKQILSLFCKVYLNISKQSIFIIDEPELSLSILWQKRLIEDIYKSGRIALLIAATHSPYIFKNEYRMYAKELRMFEEFGNDEK